MENCVFLQGCYSNFKWGVKLRKSSHKFEVLDEVRQPIHENTLQFGNWLIWGITQHGEQNDQQFTQISADTSVKAPYKRHDPQKLQHNLYGCY